MPGGEACGVRRTFRSLLRVERPFDGILDEAVPEHRAGVVENDSVELARRRPKSRPIICRYSPIFFVGRARMPHANRWQVPTFGQDHAVGDQLGLAGREPCECRIALRLRRRAVNVLALHTGL